MPESKRTTIELNDNGTARFNLRTADKLVMKIHEREESASDEQTAAIDFELKLQTTAPHPATASGESPIIVRNFRTV